MNPSYIFWGLSALFVAVAVWIWRMSEKEWLRRLTFRNYFDIDYHKYNNKKIKTASIVFGLFEAACLFLLGLTHWEQGTLTKIQMILLGCFALAPIAYWPIMLLCCKKSKYKKTYKK